jgi:histidinol dehydrogenase
MMSVRRLRDLSGPDLQRILDRSKLEIETVREKVLHIIKSVKQRGDAAVLDYTEEQDGVRLSKAEIVVSRDEIQAAHEMVDERLRVALDASARNITKYHSAQVPSHMQTVQVDEGVLVGRLFRPIESAGAYIWRNERPYPSTVLMTALPAKVAGVKRIAASTSPMRNGKVDPATLVAADIAGVQAIYRIGGPQSIAAMAFGTETVSSVDKIVGRGDIYVTAAKMLLYGLVDVDFPCGPPEVMVLADESADPEFIAADLIAQAEHDSAAAAVLVSTSSHVAEETLTNTKRDLSRANVSENARKSIERYGSLLVAEDIDEAIRFVNRYSPENLQLMVKEPLNVLDRIENAGGIYLGSYSPVVAGDYGTGPSHVIPTGGLTRIRAGLSVEDFVRSPSVHIVSKQGLQKMRNMLIELADAEGLAGHKRAILKRFD